MKESITKSLYVIKNEVDNQWSAIQNNLKKSISKIKIGPESEDFIIQRDSIK